MPVRTVNGCMTKIHFTKNRLSRVRPDEPLPGDILLFSNAVGYTKLVPWFTGSRYYHCAIYEGDGHVLEARPNGVVRRDIVNEPGNIFRIIPMPREGVERVLQAGRCCLGRRYDLLSVLFIVLNHTFPRLRLHWSSEDSFVCGEFVVYCWREAELDLFPGQNAGQVIPADFQCFLPTDARDMTMDAEIFGQNS